MTNIHPLAPAINSLTRGLGKIHFKRPVAYTYNPLVYARQPFMEFMQRFGTGRKRLLFLGMNPGPYGMVQTGVPFGEIEVVKNWLKVSGDVHKPKVEHPKRPVTGFDCSRSEISGKRFWGLMKDHYTNAENFAADATVVNYCPLVWMAESGANITPDKLPKKERDALGKVCDTYLLEVLEYYQPEIAIGIGVFAERQLLRMSKTKVNSIDGLRIERILHPSPASPYANKHWPSAAVEQLHEMRAWY